MTKLLWPEMSRQEFVQYLDATYGTSRTAQTIYDRHIATVLWYGDDVIETREGALIYARNEPDGIVSSVLPDDLASEFRRRRDA